MKPCRMCAEQIQDEALKCRFCGEMQTAPEPQPPQNPCWTCGRPMIMKPGTQVPWCESCSGSASQASAPASNVNPMSTAASPSAMQIAGGLASMLTAKSVFWLFILGLVFVASIQTCMSSDDTAEKARVSLQRREREEAEQRRQEAAAQATTPMQRVAPTPSAAAGEDPFCGPKPAQWPTDNMVLPVVSYLKRNLNDPDSYEGLGFTEPEMTKKSCWVTTCRFRAANALGAKVVQTKRFWIGKNPMESAFSVVLKVSDAE